MKRTQYSPCMLCNVSVCTVGSSNWVSDDVMCVYTYVHCINQPNQLLSYFLQCAFGTVRFLSTFLSTSIILSSLPLSLSHTDLSFQTLSTLNSHFDLLSLFSRSLRYKNNCTELLHWARRQDGIHGRYPRDGMGTVSTGRQAWNQHKKHNFHFRRGNLRDSLPNPKFFRFLW